ncbi:hypothetical protein G4228_016858 [Cervus hanglu yarkandensis]|nr:hypothetical protein G4228_016858 [Cervus hanglu yarkandensis]
MAAAGRARDWAPGSVLPLLSLLLVPAGCAAARQPPAPARLSLHPPYFNLAEAARIWATATCGEREPGGARPRPELYCKLVGGPTAPGSGHTIQGQFCDYCNSEDPRKAHPVTNAIDGSERWWQSPPLSSGMQYNKVNVTLDLGQLFQVAYVLIKFANSPRPDLWVLERSVDFGSTYSPWQYFAHSKVDCLEQFGQEANRAITRDDDVLCTTEYSRIVPLENGEVVVSLINGRPGAKNFTFSHALREFTKATNIRLRFLRTNTLLGHLISKAQRDPTVTRRYYYSIKDISIGGRCVCNGHAEVCNANNPEKLFRCECQHNTCGETCDHCCTGYNQRRWRPAMGKQSNECEACNCHGHSTDCYYDPDVERQQASLNIQGLYAGGGVCINCQHNTAGVNCEKCAKGYYRPYGIPAHAPDGCIQCRCHVAGTMSGIGECGQLDGDCHCKSHVGGDSCDTCEDGYFALEKSNYFGCQGCRCDIGGAVTPVCSGPSGVCQCRGHVVGKACQRPENNYYFPDLHHMRYEIEDGTTPSGRALRFGFDPLEFPEFSWRGYAQMTPVQDYLVLLPRDYYEAPSLQLPVTEPCADVGHPQENCLLYQHLPVTRFPCALACEARHFLLDGEPRPLAMRQPTPAHPVMADLSGREVELHLRLWVPRVGRYVIMVEYASEAEQLSEAAVHVQSPGADLAGRVDIYSCKYSVLCRSAVTDGRGRLAVYELLADADVRLRARMAQFLLHQICIIPIEEFSTEYLRPHVKCIASYGRFVNQSAFCVSLPPETPPTALILDVPSGGSSPLVPEDPSPPADAVLGVTLKAPQNQVTLRGLVPRPGRYVIIVHFYQPAHPTFPAQVSVDGGRLQSGIFRASFCPHVLGCQDQVIAGDQVEFDISEPEVALTVTIPEGKSLVLVRVLVVPAENYDYQILHRKSLDKSLEFVTHCGGDSFYIDPQRASEFCKNSARSLVALYHEGALPCECHPAGAIGHPCSPEGGQCPCRPHVIGRQCTRCQTGFYGFPHCRPCSCGRRLCEETTGRCLCPPQTVRPQCDVCDVHSFSFHPLAGCEGCNCSRTGTDGAATLECDRDHGQCRCKPRITGRQCDRCAPGFYRFPECLPCHCSRDGTEPGVCDPGTGACLCKFVDMMGWRLQTADGVDIPVSFNPGSSSAVADLQELPATVRSASWVAPPSYLGDKVSSYGGYLTYQIKSFGLPADMVPLENKPDVQLIGQHMSVIYHEPNHPRPDRLHHGRVQMVEGNFRHAGSRAPVSREELMTVLSSLRGVHLRGLYFTETQRLALSGVGLEEASETGSGRRAQSVEMCACPPDHIGDSCQNCQHNTAGEHCERCKEGYYWNTIHGSCSVCPCPHSDSFATGCVVTGENIKCSCKPGYTGSRCERCAPGYFGNPQKFGGSCQPCNCNSNGQLGSCDPLNGDCDSCVMTLLNDLATMDDELRLVKSQLQGLSVSAGTLEQIRHLETQTKDLRNQLFSYRPTISNHKSKMDALEKELSNLNHEFETLQEKVQINSRKAQAFYNDIDRTTQSTKELDSKIKNVIRNVHTLVKQVSGTEGDGNRVPSGDFSRELAEAGRMMREMRTRNFGKQLREAEAERREAQQLLNQIRSWLENHQVENNGLAKNIRDALNDYEAKLSGLRAALQEASAQAKQATGLNRENERALESIKRQVKEMNSLQSDFTKRLATADSSLMQTNIVLQLMKKSHEEYEKLAVTLNEARHELSDKVRELSRSASRASLVEEAERHSQSLQELAKQLEEIKRNASGDELVRCAVDAATAYENILNAIKAAEDAADKATTASEAALQTVIKEDLPRKAKTLSSSSDKLLNEAKITQQKLQQEISPAINNLQQTLKTMTVQKGLIDTNLTSIRGDLHGIQRDDIDGIINSAKSLVRNANDITNEVLDGLNPIQTDVERIKDTYGSTQSEDFNKALSDADNSVKKLTNKLPDLLSKIESINQQLLPLGNISDNVDRIRELIQQARDAANKVAVPMRFNGRSGVEVRLPNDLEDLKGYTSLSLFLQRPESTESGGTENMFVMYLGNKDASRDYIGMAVVNGQLTCVYNLGEDETELQVDQTLTESKTQEAVMDRVKFQRIYQFARLNYTLKATSSKPETHQFHDMDSGNSNTLLNLDPENVVFYVGGYPSDFRPPSRLRFPAYKGCIELDDLNENVLSLYNFKKTFNLNTTEVEPCRRRKEESDKNYFEGTGYARVPTQPNAPFPTFGQTIQTTVDRGLLFFAENKILIKIGKIQQRMWINVDTQSVKIEDEIFDFGTYYLGGIPISIRERFNISTPAFRGCMKNLKKTTGVVRLNDTVGVTKKCSEDWKASSLQVTLEDGHIELSTRDSSSPILTSPQTYMDGLLHYVSVISDNSGLRLLIDDQPLKNNQRLRGLSDFQQSLRLGGSHFEGCISNVFIQRSQFAVDVLTTASRGLVFYTGTRNSFMALYLSKGRLVFALGAEGRKLKLKSKEKCSDGKWHTVTFGQDGGKGRLVVDGLRTREGRLPENYTISLRTPVYLGLAPSGKPKSLPQNSFVGCLRNFQLDLKPLETPSASFGVSPCLGGSLEKGIYFSQEGGHIILVTIKQHILHLKLDADDSYMAGRHPFPPARPLERLYIGGVPGNLKTPKLPVWTSFFGCLKNIQVNHIPVPVTGAAEVQGTVSLNGCPDH